MNCRSRIAFFTLFVVFVVSNFATAADVPAAAEAKPAETTSGDQSFNTLFTEWKALLNEMRDLRQKYKTANAEDRNTIQSTYDDLVTRGEGIYPRLMSAAEADYEADPVKNAATAELLSQVVKSDSEQGRDKEAFERAKKLLTLGYKNATIFPYAAKSAFVAGEYEQAIEWYAKAEAAKPDPATAPFVAEAQIRLAEAKADDLPRVRLTTTKGDIELELFENEAPIAVTNFLSLIEKGFYNNLTFHRVLEGFMAQGGDPDGNGMGGPGYTIPCECYKPGYRRHFRGSLSMAKTAQRDTGGSQFFITFTQTSQLDGKHTVFGRVISGMEVVDKLQRRDPETQSEIEPDKILKAEVLRKRPHEYDIQKLLAENSKPADPEAGKSPADPASKPAEGAAETK